jgi:dTDP-4-amino-4,6-dideoxygalactose transaminase
MAETVAINDLRRHAAALRHIVNPAVERVIDRGYYVLGPECAAFEQEFALYCGVGHCVGVANGTDALELSFRALGLGEGSRVATVANAGLYTVTALRAIGAVPIFVDVDPITQLMDLRILAGMSGFDAIVVTHLFGRLHDMDELMRIAARASVPVIEDCAQAHGASRNGRRAGSFGSVASFSFYPTKNLGAAGDGGGILTNDPAIAERARILRQYGWDKKYHSVVAGGRNSRLDELQAAILRVKLPLLDQWNERRREIASQYSRRIVNPRIICPSVPEDGYVAHLYVATCDDREGLRQHLHESGIVTDVHYPVPDHFQPSLANAGPWPTLPVTEKLARQNVTLPCYPELRDDEVDRVINSINGWLR